MCAERLHGHPAFVNEARRTKDPPFGRGRLARRGTEGQHPKVWMTVADREGRMPARPVTWVTGRWRADQRNRRQPLRAARRRRRSGAHRKHDRRTTVFGATGLGRRREQPSAILAAAGGVRWRRLVVDDASELHRRGLHGRRWCRSRRHRHVEPAEPGAIAGGAGLLDPSAVLAQRHGPIRRREDRSGNGILCGRCANRSRLRCAGRLLGARRARGGNDRCGRQKREAACALDHGFTVTLTLWVT